MIRRVGMLHVFLVCFAEINVMLDSCEIHSVVIVMHGFVSLLFEILEMEKQSKRNLLTFRE